MGDTLFDTGDQKPKSGGKAKAPPPLWVFDELQNVHGIPKFVSRKWHTGQVWAVLYRSRERKGDPKQTALRKRELVKLLTEAATADVEPRELYDLFQEALSLLDTPQKLALCRAATALLLPPSVQSE